MTDAEQGQAILRRIIDDPADDVVRLIYADWLEDAGDGERAALVRLPRGAAAAELIVKTPPASFGGPHGGRRLWRAKGGRDGVPAAVLDPEPPAAVRACSASLGDAELPDRTLLTFRRGFVESVRSTLDGWREHGPAVVRAHPVTRWELSDRHPEQSGRWLSWYDREQHPHDPEQYEHLLPAAIFRSLKGGRGLPAMMRRAYESRESALDALSAALIAVAKATCPACLGVGVVDAHGRPPTTQETASSLQRYVRRCHGCDGTGRQAW